MQCSPTCFLLRNTTLCRARSSPLLPRRFSPRANPPPSPFPEEQADREMGRRNPAFVGIQYDLLQGTCPNIHRDGHLGVDYPTYCPGPFFLLFSPRSGIFSFVEPQVSRAI
ncbi:hypothetical protein NEUTE2DRAFT_48644 [Neurospora tetrasperma FGSC 2509]|nr:hypothetical protein NEUTE2DRAFT_48644 [Neurospora tetrasperma FGSC 2509]